MNALATRIGGDLLGQPGSWAIFDRSRLHRFALAKDWQSRGDGTMGWCMWLMMNPSTADHMQLDPTLTRCEGYSRRWGYGGMLIANVCSWRCPVPEALARAEAWHLHEANQIAIRALADMADIIVCGWGSCRHVRPHRLPDLSAHAAKLRALKTNRDGHPTHPLYLRRDLELMHFGGPKKT